MKRAPEPGEDIHPMLEGLQQLKFDPADNSPDELADKYKEDGNYWLKHKKYRIAVMNYTEGLQQKPTGQELVANLYNNRSAAQFFLQNYRSSIADAKSAIEHKRDYTKAKIRILKCLLELKKFDEACKEVQEYLSEDPTNKELIDFQKVAIGKKTEKLRDERKLQMVEKKKRQDFQTLVQALIQRKVKFEEVRKGDLSSDLTPEILKPKVEPLEYHPVTLDNGTVYYPAIFCYPEFQLTDLQQQLSEMLTIHECLEDMFQPSEEGTPKYFSPAGLNVYFENRLKGKIFKVDPQKSIKDIVSGSEFWIYNGYLTFYVIPSDGQILEN
jgi:tetratricopeptide (TPR) repeat protein